MTDPLTLWNDGAAKSAIVDFVAKVADANSPTFVSPDDRIAVFDNDGTLWCEKPMYIQLDFILRRWMEMANANPALREQQPWKAAAEKDYAWLGNAVTKHYRGDDSDMPTLCCNLPIIRLARLAPARLARRRGARVRLRRGRGKIVRTRETVWLADRQHQG